MACPGNYHGEMKEGMINHGKIHDLVISHGENNNLLILCPHRDERAKMYFIIFNHS